MHRFCCRFPAVRGQVRSYAIHITPGFCPEGVGAFGGYDGCDGLRSGPEPGHLGCVWHSEAAVLQV
ncbi:hypothetical protein F4W67_11930 [Pseudomonas caricapapayae]|nr:hypothetical protein F4W67_11930 [Pseudomonas caricapapayae]